MCRSLLCYTFKSTISSLNFLQLRAQVGKGLRNVLTLSMRASHILVKHQGSRRTASWKDPDGVQIKKRSKAESINILKGLRSNISTQEDFAEIAQEYSDCGSAKSGGDLGNFDEGQMMKPFEDATRALRVGEISTVVETDSGVHIILRTG